MESATRYTGGNLAATHLSLVLRAGSRGPARAHSHSLTSPRSAPLLTPFPLVPSPSPCSGRYSDYSGGDGDAVSVAAWLRLHYIYNIISPQGLVVGWLV
eukprot:scaffold19777_cov169-Isochrysis_galbana.AAC.3